MSEDRDLTFAPLTDGNYAEWEIRMEADLVDKGLWEYVFTEVVKPEGDTNSAKKAIAEYEMKLRQARARMIRRVTAGQLPHMKDPDPRNVWTELQRVHRAGGFGSKLAMRRRFINAKMKLDDSREIAESMASWIGRVKGMRFELEAVGVNMTDEDVILVLTNGLPENYNQFVITLDAARPADITLENVVAQLANEEGRQGIDVIKKEEEKVRLGESALAATKGRRDRSEITCFYCGKKGHFRSECPERKEETKQTAAVAVIPDELFAF
jgi:gag-polypeptide of LTR copia-type/Domain of unknown function (DUF4219)/Zinc knuckle